MGKKGKRHNQGHQKKPKNRRQAEDSPDADETQVEGTKKCVHVMKAAKLGVLQNTIPHMKIGECSFCEKGQDTDAGICMCLGCGKQGCDRYSEEKHGLSHYESSPSHCLTVNLNSLMVWCYSCDLEVPVVPDTDLHECIKLLIKALKLNPLNDQVHATPKIPLTEANKKLESTSLNLTSNSNRIKGLVNLGNTCFFNAVMQNLFQLELLHVAMAFVNQSQYCQVITAKSELPSLSVQVTTSPGSLVTALTKLLCEVRSSSPGPLNPKFLFSEICKKAPRFKGFQQQDSQELLRYLLDSVKTEQLRRVKIGVLNACDIKEGMEVKSLPEKKKQNLKEYVSHATAPSVDSIFAGRLDSIVVCHNCHKESRMTESFLDLSLPLTGPQLMKGRGKPSKDTGAAQKNKNKNIAHPNKENMEDENSPRPPNLSKHQQKVAREVRRKKGKKGKKRTLSHSASDDGNVETMKSQEQLDATCDESDHDDHNDIDTTAALENLGDSNREQEALVESCADELGQTIREEVVTDREIVKDSGIEEVAKNSGIENEVTRDAEMQGTTTKDLGIEHEISTDSGMKNAITKDSGIRNDITKNSGMEKTVIKDSGIQNEITKDSGMEKTVIKDSGIQNEITKDSGTEATTIEDSGMKDNTVEECGVELRQSSKDTLNVEEKHENNKSGTDLTQSTKDFGIEMEGRIIEKSDVALEANFEKKSEKEEKVINKSKHFMDNDINSSSPTSDDGSLLNPDYDEQIKTTENSEIYKASEKNSGKKVDLRVENEMSSQPSHMETNDVKRDENSEALSEGVQNDDNATLKNEIDNCEKIDPISELRNENCEHFDSNEDNNVNETSEFETSCGVDENATNSITSGIKKLEITDKAGSVLSEGTKGLDNETGEKCKQKSEDVSFDNYQEIFHNSEEKVVSADGNKFSPTIRTLGSAYVSQTPEECSVQSCLSLFCSPELLEGRNKFACEECSKNSQNHEQDNEEDGSSSDDEDSPKGATASKSKTKKERSEKSFVYTEATKQLLLSYTPPVLTLHFKRFQQVGFGLRKVSKHVQFPLVLDLAPFCRKNEEIYCDSRQQVLYSLIGVVEHSGGLNSGHYTACVKLKSSPTHGHFTGLSNIKDFASFVKGIWKKNQGLSYTHANPRDGQWYHVSDSCVTLVTEARVLKSQAYMLFYERLPLRLNSNLDY